MGCIYQYVNKLNGHMYIGLTRNLKRRDSDHVSASRNPNNKDYNNAFHQALRKYGRENFDLNILEDNIEDDKLKDREIYWIKHFNTYEDRQHYNETPGGDMPGRNTVHIGEDHGRALLTEKDVIFCREKYREGCRSRDIYETYFKDKIAWSGFLRMWHGKTWKYVMPEVFEHIPHKGAYTAADRDEIRKRFRKSKLPLYKFVQTEECFVGYGTLYKMIHYPHFYDGK